MLEALRETWMPELPPVDGGVHVLAVLLEVGPTMAAGMGEGPVTHEELRAWQANTGVVLTPWEVRVVRRLSQEYLTQSHQAVRRDAPPPWNGGEAKSLPVVTQAQAALRALANL